MLQTDILVVDDEQEIADVVALYLKNEGFAVHKCYTAAQAIACIGSQSIDLAILDVMLPDADGFSICRAIRDGGHNYPVIMLTAKGDETDKISGLSLGADAYITKPFRPLELVARVKAQLRRYRTYGGETAGADGSVISVSGLIIDRDSHQCFLNEKPLSLTPTEFSILWHLCQNRGKVVSAEQLFLSVWGEGYYTSDNNTVMVHIRHLREKMGESGDRPRYIKTVWGVGYKLEG